MSETNLHPPAKKKSASRKKKALTTAVVVAGLIALLEAYPHIVSAINGDTQPLIEHTKGKLHEMQDAGMFE